MRKPGTSYWICSCWGVWVRLLEGLTTFMCPTNGPSSWSARAGNRMRTVVLFVFAWMLSASVCADLCCCDHTLVLLSVLYPCVCLWGRHAHPARRVDLTTWSCSSLTSISYIGHVWKYKIQDYVQNCMHRYTVCKRLRKKNATSPHKVWRKTQKRNYYIVSRLKINTGEE